MDGSTMSVIQAATMVVMLAVTAGALLLLCRLLAMTRRLEARLAGDSGKEGDGARTL